MDRLDELKAKYQPALDTMTQQGIQVTRVALDGNKLCIEGYAPTQEAKNAAWDRIKSIDSSYSDLTCDLRIGAAPDTSSLGSAPAASLAGALASAFRSDQTPAFGSMLANLFSQSNGEQRAGMLNQLLATVGPAILSGGLPGALGNTLQGGSVTPEQAQQISPDAVENLADHAEKTNPSVVDQVSHFYSQHPHLVQALGAGALAMVMTHLKKSGTASA